VIQHIVRIAVLAAVFLVEAQVSVQRSSFPIPLANLSVSYNNETNDFEKVKVSFGSSDDENRSFIIAPGDDYEIKMTREGTKKFVHTESPDKSFMISDFEAQVLNKVCKSYIQTLEFFEQDLRGGKWDRILYLDSFFPRFLKGFYYLYCSARNSSYALPRGICIPDTMYDISLVSPKSDRRISQWRQQPDAIIKLRIISKELIFQIKEWQKKELDNRNRNPEIAYGKNIEKAFTLFMKIYFDLQPVSDLPEEGEHL
jgi:hypothetical protein